MFTVKINVCKVVKRNTEVSALLLVGHVSEGLVGFIIIITMITYNITMTIRHECKCSLLFKLAHGWAVTLDNNLSSLVLGTTIKLKKTGFYC